MKKYLFVSLLLSALLSVLVAAPAHAADLNSSDNVAPRFASTNVANTSISGINLLDAAPSFALNSTPLVLESAELTAAPASPSFATALPVPNTFADPLPAIPNPEPRFLYGGRDDYRWQLGIGAAWMRFRSNVYNASAVGIDTSLSYFTNGWFAVEGNISATFAPTIFEAEHVKLLTYSGGAKVAYRQRRWEPWVHGLIGAIHAQPQTAGNSRTALAVTAGGGADYRWNPRVSFRLEGDYIYSRLFKSTQNNFLLAGGIVFHF